MDTLYEEKHSRGRCKVITIHVNDHPVDMEGHKVTGFEIKESAIAQDVPIEIDFVLSELTGSRCTQIIGDDDAIKINKHSRFIATAHDDNSDAPASVTEDVRHAIQEISATLEQAKVTFRPDGEGGAYVTVDCVDLEDSYAQNKTWIGFRITFQYPYADVYPHYVRGDLSRKDNSTLGAGLSSSKFEGREAIQISRRSNRLNPDHDTAALKLLKILKWLRSQA